MDPRRKKALDRARKLAAYEMDDSIGETEREAFTKQLEKLIDKWSFSNEELFPPPKAEPAATPGWEPPDWMKGPTPQYEAPADSNKVVDAEDALNFIADLFGM